MITQKQAEAFLQSKLALFVGMLFVLAGLLYDRQTKNTEIDSLKLEKRNDDTAHKVEIAKYQEVIYNMQQQEKIDRENAYQAERYRSEKYENLYNKYVEIDAAVKKHNIFK